jgi:hypothetical protein
MKRNAAAVLVLLAGCVSAPPPPPPPPPTPSVPTPAVAAAPAIPAAAAYPEPEALRSVFGPEYDRALAAVGLTRATARVTTPDFDLVGYGRFQLPLYKALQSDPTLADRYARTLREGAFASATDLEGATSYAAARLGVAVRLGLLGDPLAEEMKEAEKETALEEAVYRLGGALPSAASVPPQVRTAAALVLRAEVRGLAWTRLALGKVPEKLTPADASLILAKEETDELRKAFEERAGSADLRYLARAAAEVALATDRAAAMLASMKDPVPFEFRCSTPTGDVLLRGGGDDVDPPGDAGPFLLRIDTGGNDRYAAGAAGGPMCGASVLIDVAGNDTYESYPDTMAFGAGFWGIGLLVDMAGNDRYVLHGDRSLGLGAGVFGVGALLDMGGDDTYSGTGFCEGAGAVGWGTLTDLGGKDTYDAYFYSQGFGFVLGAGVLTDFAGDDTYTLNDTDIKSPSAQSKEHNDSLGQGFGFGVRADYKDGHSLAGGVGILADREGNDRYSCAVFGQGAGYWMGVGMLLDGAGNDYYTGLWYVQGACAHFAVGILDDAGGDDTYLATMNMAQGAGHDYSTGVLIDRAGNDSYTAPNLSLGGGNADGVGIFVDAAGDDLYRSSGITLGFASVATPAETPTLRHGSLTLGVFLDLGGKDTYAGDFAGDGRTWTQAGRSPKPPVSNERGVGLDR